jgi:DNA modification methylase
MSQKDKLYQILEGDCMQVLKTLPEESIQCVVTSPPYWGLRNYGVERQIGLEKTSEEYIEKIVEVFREVKRVLKKVGTCWLNLGDSYAGSGMGWATKTSFPRKWRDQFGDSKPPGYISSRQPNGLKPKDLVGIPWRCALALQKEGWWLRSDIIWAKPNPMPESVKDRPTKAHEYVFLLTKSKRYYFNSNAVREPHLTSSLARMNRRWNGNREVGEILPSFQGLKAKNMCYPKGRNIRTVWTIPTSNYRGAHFATFPEKLVEPCIKASTEPGDTVLDPFCGSGTTGVVAQKQGCSFIGIELKPGYVKLAEKRLAQRWDQKPINKVGMTQLENCLDLIKRTRGKSHE